MSKKKKEISQSKWLGFAYTIPSEPSRKRAYVWRQLKQLGAVNLHQALWVLPNLKNLEGKLQELSIRIEEYDGESSLFIFNHSNQKWSDRLISKFNSFRKEEYNELIENIEHLEFEIDRESQANKFTFAELEDIESNLEKIKKWLDRIVGRDYFNCIEKIASARLKKLAEHVEKFSNTVYEKQDLLPEEENLFSENAVKRGNLPTIKEQK